MSKSRPSCIIDVAIMQSLNSGEEVKELVKNYGMVIVDECHHVPAFSFEQILKGVHAKYVDGSTATPTRQDGHHPIIFMHCGPIRYRVDARKQAEKRPFDHYVIPRLTSFRAPLEEGKEPSIQRLYAAIALNEPRNERIVEDVVRCFQSGGNALVLTERTAHVASLSSKLSPFVTKRRVLQMLPLLAVARGRDVKVVVVTRPDPIFGRRTGHLWKKHCPSSTPQVSM